MKINRSLLIALLGAVLSTHALAQSEADVASLLPKAQRGNSIAQYRLGVAYSNGQGVAADPIEAYIWLSLAYEGGFRGKALGNVAGGLDPAQLETARQRLAERRASLILKPGPATSAKDNPADAEADIPVVRTGPAPTPATAPTQSQDRAQELAAAVADKQQLSSELSKSWSETEELKKQLAETMATADFLTAETSKLRAERDTLATKLDSLTKETATLRTERDHARGLSEQAEQALAQANGQRSVLESSLRSANESAASDKKRLGDELTKSFQETTALKARLAESAKAIASAPSAPVYPDLSNKVKELEASLTALAAEARSAREEATRLADERIDREKQLIALQKKSAELAAAHATLQQETQSLRHAAATPVAPAYPDQREQVASLETQVAALKTEANRNREQIGALTLAKAAAEKSLAQIPATPAYPDLSGKVKELEASLSAISTKANSAQQEATRLADERIEREKQLITLEQQSAELATAHRALQQEAATLRQTAATPTAPAYPDLRGQVASLETQLAASNSETSQARQQIAALTEAKEAAERSLAQSPSAPAYPDLSAKVRQLEASLAARAADAGSLGQAADELRQAKTEAEQKLAAAEQSRSELAQQYDEFKRSALANQRELVNRQSQVQMLESEKAALRQQSSADQTRLADLSAQLAASRRQLAEVYPTAPSYPDQRARVEQLETELTKTNEQANSMITLLNRSQQEAKAAADQAEQMRATIRDLESKVAAVRSAPATAAAPAYPDLREQVNNLEIQLEAARALPKFVVTEAEFSQLKQQLADTREKLATTLRGYATIEKERDQLAARPAAVAAPDQSRRVSELESQLAAQTAELNHLRQANDTLVQASAATPPTSASSTAAGDTGASQPQVAELEAKLATALKGYSVLKNERDELAARAGQSSNSQSEVARLTEAYGALQRSTAQNERDLIATRALLQQVQGSNALLAQQNTQLKDALALDPGAPRPAARTNVTPAAAAQPAPVVASAPAPTGPRFHTVVAGDTLVKISQRYYGTTTNWQPIYNVNRELLGPNGALRVGTELRIP